MSAHRAARVSCRIRAQVPLSSRETCIWEMPIRRAIRLCDQSSKKRR
jgi:hypothetical protein